MAMAAGIVPYPSDMVLSVEADGVLVREPSFNPLQKDVSLDPERNPGLASGFPEGGNYVLTKDSRAFANPSVGDIAVSTAMAAETTPEDAVGGPGALDDGDFAREAAMDATLDEHTDSVDLSDTHFAGTDGVLAADPLLDTLVSDTISGVPTPENSNGVAGRLEEAGIVPNVVDRFTPTTTVRVVYNDNLEISNGTKVMESDISKPPKVEIEGAFVMPGTLYTIMLVDPHEGGDHESGKSKDKEHVRWLHVNYQGPQDIGSAVARAGADVVRYEAPKAGKSSTHQLAFLLFRQRGRLDVPSAHFADHVSARTFSASHNLTPVGALCFTVA